MKKNQQYEWIASYLAGELSPSQQLELEQWLQTDAQHQRLFDETKQLWEAAANYDHEVYEGDDKTAWQQFESKMDWQEKKSTPSVQTAKVIPISPFKQWSRIAAILLFAFVAGWWLYQSNGNSQHNWQLVSTMDGQKKTVTLPDGSTVELNENSQLSYINNFVNNRQLILRGEAFFDVVRDEAHPFSIESEKTMTTVLGTSFNIRAYPNEAFVEVYVATGKVSFSENLGHQTPLLLEKENTGTLNKKDWTLQKENTTQSNALAWKSKTLIFEDAPLQNVIADLNRCYGKPIVVQNDKLNNCRFKGTFEQAQLKEILQALEFALDITTEKQDETYLLQGAGCE